MYKTHISRTLMTTFISFTMLFTSLTPTMAADFSSVTQEAAPDVAITEKSTIAEEDVFTEEAAPKIIEESAAEIEPWEEVTDLASADVTAEDAQPGSTAADPEEAEMADPADEIVGSANVQDPTVETTEERPITAVIRGTWKSGRGRQPVLSRMYRTVHMPTMTQSAGSEIMRLPRALTMDLSACRMIVRAAKR